MIRTRIVLAFAGLERSKGLTQILDRWIHLRHSNHVGDSSLSSDDTRSPSRISTEVRHNLRATELTATYLPSVSGYSSPRCSKSTTPNLLSRPSSPQFLITTASLAARSAACIRTLALLLVNRHKIVDTICVRYGFARMPSNRKGAHQCGSFSHKRYHPTELTESANHCAETIKHHVVFKCLLRECVDDAVDEEDFQSLVDVRGS